MSAVRSGFVVEVPLGLWSSVEFAFIENGDMDITEARANLVDDGEAYAVPEQLEDFVRGYLSTWLLEPHPIIAGSWRHKGWVSEDYWQEQTTERLADLLAHGQARREEQLD